MMNFVLAPTALLLILSDSIVGLDAASRLIYLNMPDVRPTHVSLVAIDINIIIYVN